MARPLRIEYEDAWYHVMNRGAGKKNIFYTEDDKKLFIEILAQSKHQYKIEIHAYCLMSNHYHLLIKTPFANLSRAMRHLNSVYTQKINRIRKTDGAIFRGRYKAILVEEEDYLIRLTRYIHLNPVVARICKNPEDYAWSSYKYYLKNPEQNHWLTCKEILNYFGKANPHYQYENFINEGLDEEIFNFYQTDNTFPLLGTKHFINKIKSNYLQHKKLDLEISQQKMLMQSKISINAIMQHVAEHFNIDVETIKNNKKGKSNFPRAVAIYLAVELSHLSFTKIAKEFYNMSDSGISKVYRKFYTSDMNQKQIKQELNSLVYLIRTSEVEI